MSVEGTDSSENRSSIPEAAMVSVEHWRWRSGERIWTARLPGLPIEHAFSPDGDLLTFLCAGDKVLTLETGAGRIRSSINVTAGNGKTPPGPHGASFVTYGEEKGLTRWSATDGQQIPGLKSAGRARRVWFSRVGGFLVTEAKDFTLQVLELATGRLVSAPIASPADVLFSDLLDDLLVTVSSDGFLRLWNWQAGALACAPIQAQLEATNGLNWFEIRLLSMAGRSVVIATQDSLRLLGPLGHP